ncbi:MAG: S41 family peptidase [Bacteroides sp.]|nr:S41 family peptidase [Bacteroides sp.]MCM1550118.1 S41 family peptidase [Clostridium sp.]
MRKSIKIGLGLSLAAMLCSGCLPNLRLSQSSSSSNSVHNGFGGGSTSQPGDSVYSEQVEQKIDYINQLIDSKFYFEASDDEEREEYIYKGILESLDDPYSVYYTAEEYSDMMDTSTGSYQGIGVSIQQDVATKTLTVIRVFQGSGAEDAGILPKDVITAVNGRELDGEEVSEVVTWIKGEPGTTVDVTVYRPSTKEDITLSVERRTIDNSTVSYSMKENHIGYIEVTDFYEKTAEQFALAIQELEAQGMQALIVDLRNNPGGYVNVVVDMCNQILSEGIIVYTEDKEGNVLEKFDADNTESMNLPMVVLVNGNSASASEIFAGCMKDHGAATIVGTTTFGKGIVQQVIPLSDGSAVKLTIAKYFTPNGNDIHQIGIEPDVVVELPEELQLEPVIPEEQDVQLKRAIELLSNE